MTKPLRWGILGAAKFAREHMAPAMMLAKNTELAALATSSADKAAAFTSLHPSLQIHSDYDALLNDPAIDAVYICLLYTSPSPRDLSTSRMPSSA